MLIVLSLVAIALLAGAASLLLKEPRQESESVQKIEEEIQALTLELKAAYSKAGEYKLENDRLKADLSELKAEYDRLRALLPPQEPL